MASPQISEAKEKCFVQFSEEKNLWKEKSNEESRNEKIKLSNQEEMQMAETFQIQLSNCMMSFNVGLAICIFAKKI